MNATQDTVSPPAARHANLRRFMLLFMGAGLFAVGLSAACLEEVCSDMRTAEFTTMDDLRAMQIEKIAASLDQSDGLVTRKLNDLQHPVKLPDGTVRMPQGWLPPLAAGHPWAVTLTPSDDAFYSFFEERVVRARLFDPDNAQHRDWAAAYLAKARSASPEFVGWTNAAGVSECRKIKYDAEGTTAPPDAF